MDFNDVTRERVSPFVSLPDPVVKGFKLHASLVDASTIMSLTLNHQDAPHPGFSDGPRGSTTTTTTTDRCNTHRSRSFDSLGETTRRLSSYYVESPDSV